MFLDEARINARLSHSNVVQVIELGQVEGKYFMAMEYVAGLSVAQVGKKATQRLGDVPQNVACGIIAQACAGLHYAHEQHLPDGTPLGIIHRDVSPQNLILTFEGHVKVVDFGIAKAEGRQHRTRAGLVKGKSSYMSPEQCLGLPLDRRSDVFALGIVLYELCTARRLFKRGSAYATFEAITKADVPPPRGLNHKIDEGIEKVIMKALERLPDNRYATAGEMQEALERAMHKAGLRGARSDLEKFVEATFQTEMAEQGKMLNDAQQGALLQASNAVSISAVAEHAAAESKVSSDPEQIPHLPPPLPPDDDDAKTTVAPLPNLAEDSGRTPLADPEDFKVPGEEVRPTHDTGSQHALTNEMKALDDMPSLTRKVPPVYYVMAVLGALLVAIAVLWLLAY
jgi:serine/threonine protein kinase